MKALGLIGGWDTHSHDAAAAAVEDGTLLFACEEERFVRRKHAFGLRPSNAIDACMAQCGWAVDDLDTVAVGWDPYQWQERPADSSVLKQNLPSSLLPVDLSRLIFVDHHDAHLASSLLCHGGEVYAAGIVVDGHGERRSASLYDINPNGYHLLGVVDIANSPGLFYESVAAYCGLGSMSAGKLMGLAAYGRPQDNRLFEINGIRSVDEIVNFPSKRDALALTNWPQRLVEQVFPYQRNSDPNDVMRYADLAATAQRDLEEALLSLVSWLRQRVPHKLLLASGGVFLNCRANTRLAIEGGFDTVRIFPASNDAGVAAGAAIEACRRSGIVPREVRDLALGASHPVAALRRAASNWGFASVSDDREHSLELVSNHLSAGEIVLFFHGRSEFGPRALCHRSVLASPGSHSQLLRLNRLKRRETWRPLAPVLLEEDYDAVFQTPFLPTMRHMLAAARLRPEWRSTLAAVCHVDGTSRPQVVDGSSDHPIVGVLRRFRERTGLPCLVNTSLNIAPDPIAESPDDALAILNAAPHGVALYLDGLFLKSGGGQ